MNYQDRNRPARKDKEPFAHLRQEQPTRFTKSFSHNFAFGSKVDYEKEVTDASLGKLAYLVKICGFLMLTKVARALFWRRTEVLAAEADCQEQGVDKK
jgi:hypothetical protein